MAGALADAGHAVRLDGLDVAGAVIEFIPDRVDFPEIDLRQRLTVSKGYGVADIVIPDGSHIVGKTIAESGLREREIAVLNLHRGTNVISNPKASRVLEAGDKLLCYGKLEEMRELVPAKQRRKRKIKAVKLDPTKPMAYNNLGVELNALERHVEAIEAFKKAVEIAPFNPKAINNYGW